MDRLGTLCQSALLSALFLFAAFDANADPQPPYQSAMAPQPPANPPRIVRPQYPASWYYDPYTNGSTVCPQAEDYGPEQCKRLVSPSYPAR
jgi:hypothetical protein